MYRSTMPPDPSFCDYLYSILLVSDKILLRDPSFLVRILGSLLSILFVLDPVSASRYRWLFLHAFLGHISEQKTKA